METLCAITTPGNQLSTECINRSSYRQTNNSAHPDRIPSCQKPSCRPGEGQTPRGQQPREPNQQSSGQYDSHQEL